MGVTSEFETLEQQFVELIGEFRTITISESRLRESLRSESTRAEAAEAGRAAAERAAAEARNGAAAATAAVTKATTALASTQEHLTGLKIHLELTLRHEVMNSSYNLRELFVKERQRKHLEDRCYEMSEQISSLERQIQQLKPLQSAHTTLQRQYTDLQERICNATEEARRESTRLESELRRVEKCAAAGSEIRERARLAAAAHARERRLASAELQHTNRELLAANAEISKLRANVAELQLNLSEYSINKVKKPIDPDVETLSEVRAALEAERAGAAKLEKALSAALEDNARLAAQMHNADNPDGENKALTPSESTSTNICPIDSFLA